MKINSEVSATDWDWSLPEKMEPDSSQRCLVKGREQWMQIMTSEIPIRHYEKNSPSGWSQTGTGAEKRGISVLRDIQDLAGQSPG